MTVNEIWDMITSHENRNDYTLVRNNERTAVRIYTYKHESGELLKVVTSIETSEILRLEFIKAR